MIRGGSPPLRVESKKSFLGGLFILFFSSRLGWCSVYLSTRSKRMHWMDARALRRKDAFRGERPWGDTVCDPWISDRETVSKLRGKSALFGLLKLSELKHLSS